MRFSALRSRRSRLSSALLGCVVALAAGGVLTSCSSQGATGARTHRDRAPGTLLRADTALSVGRSPWALAVADFNEDGAPDIAVANMRDRSVSLLFNASGGGIFHRNTNARTADTTIAFESGSRPRALAACDVNADGLPDLVVLLAQDSLEVALDRIVVLLNRGTGGGGGDATHPRRPVYDVGYDELVGRGLYDLFVGGLDKGKGSVNIVAASASEDTRPVVLSRITRRADILDSTINVAGTVPENGAVGVGVREPIVIQFDAANVDTAKFARALRDSHWVHVTGLAGGEEPRTIAATIHTQTARIDNENIVQYVFTPVHPFRPQELVTVTLSGDIRVRVPLPRAPGQQTPPDSITLRLPEAKGWTFEVEGLRVIASDPKDGAIGVSTESSIEITFNYWLAPGSIPAALRLLGGNGEIPFDAAYDPDSTIVRLDPKRSYVPYEHVQVIIDESLRDSTGRASFGGDTLAFQTVGPLVLSTVPANGALVPPYDAVPEQRIVLRFNASMRSPDLTSLVVIGEQSGWHSVGALEVGAEGKEVSAQVLGTFIPGERVTAIATDRFTSVEGSYPLAKPYVWRFAIRPSASASLTRTDPGVGDDLTGGTVAGGRFTLEGDWGVVMANTSGSVGLFTAGTDPWVLAATVTGVPGRQVVRAGDLDGDGLLDLVIARTDSNYVAVLLNTSGSGSVVTFAEPKGYEVGEGPVALFIGDLDGDGWPDIVTANVSTNDISVLANQGDGTFGRETFYVVGDHPQAVDGADLDGDGDLDLIVANSSSDTITLLRNLTSLKPPPGGQPERK